MDRDTQHQNKRLDTLEDALFGDKGLIASFNREIGLVHGELGATNMWLKIVVAGVWISPIATVILLKQLGL